ncbi:MAG: DUF1634 domain-containing protein [Deltaproteobacteria bacterium]|nr:DUF1634 domain-containing protein [Candidatus Zymogenaceae bacterium]
MSRPCPKSGPSKLDRVIIGLLITGVTASIVLEAVGLALFCHSHGRLTVSTDTTVFIHGRNLGFLMHHVADMIDKQGIDIFLMTLGIIVLVSTPFVRVIVSMVYFAIERDAKFFLITFFVFAVLLISLLIH